jgi:eukaryotic-like serine/threonine-protein kinase
MPSFSSHPQSPLGLSPGTRLNGIYEIDSLIGSGGMADVFKGHAIQTGDKVAIKIIRSDLAQNATVLALFRREAAALHNLRHEAIVRYLVFAVEPTLGHPYLAMEFVEGQSLATLLRKGPLTFEGVVALMRRIAGGLQAAHERGIVHRDISPDNIIVPGGDVGRAKIIDFGIARSTRLADGTVIGSGFAGKYSYVSPEQLGLAGGEVTAKSDIYSLGLVLAEALSGQPIDMGGSQSDIVEKRRRIPDLGAFDPRIRPLLAKMLEPLPADRPESMAAVAAWSIAAPDRPDKQRGEDRRESGEGKRNSVPRSVKFAFAGLAGAAALGAIGFYLLPPTPPVKAPAPPVLHKGDTMPSLNLEASGARETHEPVRPAGNPQPAPVRPAGSVVGNADVPPLLKPSGEGDTTPTLSPPRPAITAPADVVTKQSESAAERVDTAPTLDAGVKGGTTSTPGPVPATTVTPPDTPTELASNVAGNAHKESLRPDPLPNGGSAAILKISGYIKQFDGGDCFFAEPVSVTENTARIEGYGASTGPFDQLDDAFRRNIGFEADIGVREVTVPECPAVNFLSRIRNDRGASLTLSINTTQLRGGEPLTGKISGVGSRHLELLLVSDTGSVQNLSRLLNPEGEAQSFDIRMQSTEGTGGQPELLIAIASSSPLATLAFARPVGADQLFPLVLREASTGGDVTAAAKYFKLQR